VPPRWRLDGERVKVVDRKFSLFLTQGLGGHLLQVHRGQYWPGQQVSSLKTVISLGAARPTGLLQKSHLSLPL
jgi:hypothetical protein